MDQKESILNAAIKHFAARGYRRTTLDEVAAEVGLGTPALYHYFKNKMDLFKAVTEREVTALLCQLEAAVAKETDPVRRLRVFCRTRFKLTVDKQAVFQITERVHREIVELVHKVLASLVRREAALVEGILERGVRNGAFRPMDVPMTASLLLQMFRYLETPGGFFSNPKEVGRRVDFALDILLQGIEVRP